MPIHRRSRSTGAAGPGSSGTSAPVGSNDGVPWPRQATPRYLVQSASKPADRLLIQRQEDASVPEVPRYQLTPPSLLQPRDPYARYYPDFGNQLRLDPELELRIRSMSSGLLSASSVLADVTPLVPVVAIPVPRDSLGGPSSGGPLAPTAPQPDLAPTPAGAPVATPQTSPSPDATSESGPRAGSAGDVLGAVMALPQVSMLLDDVQNRFTSDFSLYWNRASTGEQVGFVSSSVIVGGAILAPLLGFEEPRNFVLPLLNDVVLPVPGLSGYGLEFNFGERSVMVGVHVDVGRLLHSFLDFDAASFSPIGGPPGPAPGAIPPLSRMADGDASSVDHASIAAGVRGRTGKGSPLDADVQTDVERQIGADLSEVRIHTDDAADDLARSVRAQAFTTGRDIFFRAGRYDPDGGADRKLLTHELVHVAQQPTAAPQGSGDSMTISTPEDGPEREAERISSSLDEDDRSSVP